MFSQINPSRRAFLANSLSAIGFGLLNAGAESGDAKPAIGAGRKRNRVGSVAYGYQYSIGLFSYKNRPGHRFDAVEFIEANHRAGGEVAQLFFSMVADLDEDGLKRLRRRAEELDVLLELHGGGAIGPKGAYEDTMRRAALLGCKVVGCTFGMLLRPRKIATLAAWDEHTRQCEARLRELAPLAKSLGLTIGVENHLDFTVEELRDLIRRIDSPQVGVILDVGNTVGTLDDPVEAADLLGPYTIATHYKDFAITETPKGFTFCMVPLGCGSLQLPAITKQLLKHANPEMGLSIEMMNGQHFDVNWLEEGFWSAFRDKPAPQVAATLRHIRAKAIDPKEYKLVEEIDALPHEERLQLEQDRMSRCIAYLKTTLADAMAADS